MEMSLRSSSNRFTPEVFLIPLNVGRVSEISADDMFEFAEDSCVTCGELNAKMSLRAALHFNISN